MGTAVPVIAPIRARSRIGSVVPWLAVPAAVAATALAGYLEYVGRYDWSFIVPLSTALFLGTGILLAAQHRHVDGALALSAGLLLVPQGLTVPLAGLADSGWTRPLDLAFVVPTMALVLRVPGGRLTSAGRALVGVLAVVLVVAPAAAVAAGSMAPTTVEAAVTSLTLVGTAVFVAIGFLRGGRLSRQARVPLVAVTVGMLLAGVLQVYGETLTDGPSPLPWTALLGLQGPRDIRDFCAAMIPVALVAEAIRRAEARADIGRRVVAAARASGVDGVLEALRSGLREPDVHLLPPGAIEIDAVVPGQATAVPPHRRRIPVTAPHGAPLGVLDLPDGHFDPLVLEAALAAARVGLEHADAVVRLQAQIGELEASRLDFVSTVEGERRRLKSQLSSGLRAPLQGLAIVLAEASAALGRGDEEGARKLLVAARARLAAAHADLRLLARGVYPAVLSQSGLAVALRALAEESPAGLRVVVSPTVEARRRSAVVEAAAYFAVAAATTGEGVLGISVAADPPPDGDGIELVLSGTVPVLTTFIASDEARRVAALGGVISPNDAGTIQVRVPGVVTRPVAETTV